MNRSARYLCFLVLAQALAFVAVIGWRICRRPVPYMPKQHVYMELRGSLPTMLNMFSNDCGRYPTTAEGLNALLNPTNVSLKGWHGPYFDPPEVPRDPWGHEYVYRFPGTHNANGFDLYSLGPDGISKSGGSDLDDINNWDESSPHGGTFLTFEDGQRQFLSAMGVLLVIPFLFVVRLIKGVVSPCIRAFGKGYLAADILWLLLSIAVVAIFLAFITTNVVGR